MSKQKVMHLTPAARLQRFLGNELIADPNLAVLEFVKNAYDAGATNVIVDFELTTDEDRLSIADNGIGMSEDSFRFNWLRPGFSQKAREYRHDGPRIYAEKATQRVAADRAPAGEKGLGRLSAGRLGDELIVWTRENLETPWLKVTFDWTRFDDMYKSIDEIDVPFAFVDQAPPGSFPSGTYIEIRRLRQTWLGRVPGRPAPGRPRTRMGRLKQDLAFLVKSNPDRSRAFSIDLASDHPAQQADTGVIAAESATKQTAQYIYEFDVALDRDHDEDGTSIAVRISRRLRRSAEASATTGKPTEEILTDASLETMDPQSWPGPFSGLFYYTPPKAGRRAQEIDAALSGVLLYRDDILVEPYGLPGDDWLGVEARKASRQGHAAIQPSTFSGEIAIARDANPDLVDMSNRLGLLEGDRSTKFIDLAQAEFRFFEEIIYQEVLVDGNWQGKSQQKAADQANRAEQVAQARLRALAHRAGQPIMAAGFDIVGMQLLAKRVDLPEDARARVAELALSLESHVRRLTSIIEELSRLPNLSATQVILVEVIDRVRASLGAELSDAEFDVIGSVDAVVFGSSDLVFEVIHELVQNGLEAPRGIGRPRIVSVQLDASDPRYVEVSVRDNGTGFPPTADLERLANLTSTKARPAGGLAGARNAVTAMQGLLYVEHSSDDGSTITVRLPTGSNPVPRIER